MKDVQKHSGNKTIKALLLLETLIFDERVSPIASVVLKLFTSEFETIKDLFVKLKQTPITELDEALMVAILYIDTYEKGIINLMN